MSGVGVTVDVSIAVQAGSDEAGFAFVACPSPSLAWRVDLRDCRSRALLRAADGSLWLLGMDGLAWTRAHLAAANARLCQRAGRSVAGIAATLAAGFTVRSISLTVPRTLCARRLWDVERIGDLLLGDVMRRRRQSSGGAEAESRAATAERLRSNLDSAVSVLVATLDAENLMLAMQCAFDARIYNWLLRGDGERRRQFVRAFPLLLPQVVSGRRAAAELERIVDRGERLVEQLAASWSVRPAVIRALQQPATPVPPMCRGDARRLAATFDALPPEAWPRDRASWRRFGRLLQMAMRRLTSRPWESTLAMAWLREALAGRTASDDDDVGERLRDGVLRVQQLRDALVELLAASLRPLRSSKAASTKRAAQVVDGFLRKLAPAQLLALADRYREALLQAIGSDVLANHVGLLHGGRGWPLMADDYESRDGARRVVPVCSRRELRRCGEIFENCLRGSHFDGYARRLAEGSAFYVLLLDMRTARPCSLAELAVDERSETRIRVSVLQHQTPGNAAVPSKQCRTALAELLRLTAGTPQQAHLHKGLIALRATAAATGGGSIVGRSARAAALWKVIGAAGMTAMRQRLAVNYCVIDRRADGGAAQLALQW